MCQISDAAKSGPTSRILIYISGFVVVTAFERLFKYGESTYYPYLIIYHRAVRVAPTWGFAIRRDLRGSIRRGKLPTGTVLQRARGDMRSLPPTFYFLLSRRRNCSYSARAIGSVSPPCPHFNIYRFRSPTSNPIYQFADIYRSTILVHLSALSFLPFPWFCANRDPPS